MGREGDGDITKADGRLGQPRLLSARGDDGESYPDDWPGVVAFYPAAIKGVVLSNTAYLAPNPWCPVVNGRDILAERVTAAYAAGGFDVVYVDDYFLAHAHSGDVHCLTNTIREVSGKWWQRGDPGARKV